ncbi:MULTISPECIES: PAS domain-containing protein [Marinobacter]|jgi:PAS domain-containing protein|uniref:PAS sensor protein n=1 Tax=Marinobacter salarius TaxID=1420917 RepID=W5YQ63_9GAMM|nr:MULTISPECIES: PAS domain-containing protein [Marinobacter]AHI31024.1 PAS sensor protein [Marinobacter salarius]MAB53394.1 histidine kinase [Marinobacter sp.]MCZ4286524.1 PAS domain-containing protein [Marinobacter salarius]MDM8178617.1 PAS domain-containing protein [Marinobacter salarius]RUT76233.1 histidine kinase [Marinobacter sp. NP-6]|tara:strand:- start:1105 stop:2103 length:999 start_codon:yes stop_codon:yes gene_type:complete
MALPHLWAPLLVLFAGLVVTGLTAQALEEQSRSLAEQVYRKQHNALVARLRGYDELPPLYTDGVAPARTINNVAPAELWLATVFKDAVPGMLNLRVDTLERHTKTPLFQAIRAESPDRSQSLRSEVAIGEHRWLVTTLPDSGFLSQPAHRSFRFIWLAGLAMTVLATVVVIFLCLRIRRWQSHYRNAEKVSHGYEQQLNNMQVEKSILRQALNDSEQRSRDLVALSGATICELDEKALTGYISPQVVELLNKAPADLAGTPFEQLVDPTYVENFLRTLQASRQERQIQRIDLKLLDADDRQVSVTLRVLALQDTLHGFSGYRLSLQPGIQAP